MRITILAALVAVTLPAAARAANPVAAPSAPHVYRTTVSLGDLNLGRSKGAGVALARIRHAADRVCGSTPLPAELTEGRRHRACTARAIEAAVRDLDAPMVSARYYGADPIRTLAAN